MVHSNRLFHKNWEENLRRLILMCLKMPERVTHRWMISLFKIEDATWPIDCATLLNQCVCKTQGPNTCVARCLIPTNVRTERVIYEQRSLQPIPKTAFYSVYTRLCVHQLRHFVMPLKLLSTITFDVGKEYQASRTPFLSSKVFYIFWLKVTYGTQF